MNLRIELFYCWLLVDIWLPSMHLAVMLSSHSSHGLALTHAALLWNIAKPQYQAAWTVKKLCQWDACLQGHHSGEALVVAIGNARSLLQVISHQGVAERIEPGTPEGRVWNLDEIKEPLDTWHNTC